MAFLSQASLRLLEDPQHCNFAKCVYFSNTLSLRKSVRKLWWSYKKLSGIYNKDYHNTCISTDHTLWALDKLSFFFNTTHSNQQLLIKQNWVCQEREIQKVQYYWSLWDQSWQPLVSKLCRNNNEKLTVKF